MSKTWDEMEYEELELVARDTARASGDRVSALVRMLHSHVTGCAHPAPREFDLSEFAELADPSVEQGDIVCYCEYNSSAPASPGAEWPAIVTTVWSEDCVNLTVFRGGGQVIQTSVLRSLDGEARPGSWRFYEMSPPEAE